MNGTKTLAINLLILILLLITAEGFYRFARFSKNCFFRQNCDPSLLSSPGSDDISKPIRLGLAQYDTILGYIPKAGFNKTIDAWNSLVTINQDGFRSNDNSQHVISYKHPILVSGDSFTFGDQVNNNETWPSCVERTLAISVDNAGVFGYGAAQAQLRLERIINLSNKNYSHVILSILVASDFNRDRLSFNEGFPRPAVITLENGNLSYSKIPNPNIFGSKFAESIKPNLFHKIVIKISEFSVIARKLAGNIFLNLSLRRTESHPNAASKKKIIQWTIENFSKIKSPRSILLQYPQEHNNQEIESEKELIKSIANEYNVNVIDTLNMINSSKKTNQELYSGHHTALGNELVCKAIVTELTNKTKLK